MMNKWIRQMGIMVILICLGFGLTGCGTKKQAETRTQEADDKIKIVCTVYPAYEWTMTVLGDRADDFEVSWLLSKGTDIHNYQPSVADIAKIRQSDLFIYVGGESDKWAAELLAEDMPDTHKSIVLMDVADMSLVEEDDEGIIQQEPHEHEDHDHSGDDEETHEDHDHEDEKMPEYDEHVWLSLKNARIIVDEIAEEITELTADTSGIYLAHAAAYDEQLDALDVRYKETIDAAEKHTLIFADRFPFRYMAKDYGLAYYAAFNGCSAETEASFETLISLAEKVDELDTHYLLIIDGSDETLARTVISITEKKDQEVLMMDSLQAVTEREREEGLTYLQVMNNNLKVMEKALN